ncbi:hypothetical protein SAMN05444336_10297 [Albimonas donghaensis]|uniref:Fenitrothion hydrolase n=1 Tax=Albimonas donghaensis TaxID=356660 RepID=A0A1H2VJY7_9RHOB|nr:hypothetical protein [Albimonas donghaensis]SDW68705.1 hypothetical protein SAMN05444336_10297 [Albimonas donghaensis]
MRGRPLRLSLSLSRSLALAVALAALPSAALAHTGERALALLLPTEIWAPAGTAVVALTALLLAFVRGDRLARLAEGAALPVALPSAAGLGTGLSLLSAAILAGLCLMGWFGPRNPLVNLATLALWTGVIALLPAAQLAFGNLWGAINPWSGPLRLASRLHPRLSRPMLRLPERLGAWPAVASWLAIMSFALADRAPLDPARVASVMAGYWAAIFALGLVFGAPALRRIEGLGLWLSLFAALAPLRIEHGRPRLRLPGLGPAAAGRAGLVVGAGGFAVAALGAGSFDGFNETFVWLDFLGVNPLQFPGRSAVRTETMLGLYAAVALMAAIFVACTLAGLALAGLRPARGIARALEALALGLVPIVAGYHVAHYLPATLVETQYLLVALGDPLDRGWDLTGLDYGHAQVTTSFFNQYHTVRLIWLAQAGAVVAGHAAGIAVAHLAALRLADGDPRRAARSQFPLALFMVVYTLFGLWLLAAPTGA